MVEIRYAGVTVARSSAVRELDTKGLFLGLTEPLPSGTDVLLKVGEEEVPVRVATVVESADISKAGMRVLFRVAGKAKLFGEPASAGDPAPETIAPRATVSTRDPAAPVAPIRGPGSTSTPISASASVREASGRVASGPVSASVSAPVATEPSGGRRIVVDASAEKPVPDKIVATEASAPAVVAVAAAESKPESSKPVAAAPATEAEREPSKKHQQSSKKSKRR